MGTDWPAARDFDFLSSVVALAIDGFLLVLYGTLFAMDRRRVEHGWFTLQIAGILPACARLAGLLDRQKPRTGVVVLYAALAGVFAAAAFGRRYFHRRPLHRGWIPGLALLGVALLLPSSPAGCLLATRLAAMLVLFAISWQIVQNVREVRRGRDPFPAALLAFAWVQIALVSVPDLAWLTGLGVIAGGFEGIGVGTTVYAVCQTLVLGRDHIRSLRNAEAQLREVEQLNADLRHQIVARSRQLTDALAQAEGTVAPAALEVNDVFDERYRVVRPLGRGGMGAVYEVVRTRDGKRFALKVVTAAISARHAARFAREAEIGARIHHDNLVSIVDVGISAGAAPFLVMELASGGSMEEQRARFGDADWALPVLRQIAAGLAELHAQGIVHRDLKPGNVLLVQGHGESDVIAKISDFGISRFGALDDTADVDAQGETVAASSGEESPRTLTQTGALMGTPLYMPPEALLEPAKHASADMFSFGILAYEALTGRAPFPVPPVILARGGHPLPAPSPLDGIDAPVAAMVLACLRAAPAERPRAKDVAEAIGGSARLSAVQPRAGRLRR